MSDIMQIVFGEAQELSQQVTEQARKVEEQLGQVRSGVGITLTPGVWEGTGAENFGQYITTQYIPEVMALIASITGMGMGISQGLEIFQNADNVALNEVNNLVSEFSFF